MKFSILLSLYYKESPVALNQCFLSIWQEQSIHPNEIILVLDGDIGVKLHRVIDSWRLKIGDILKVIPLSKNIGLGQALNEGLKHCTNEWVFRMDTDDICKPDRFEKQISFIKENPDVVLFSGQILEFDKDPQKANVLKSVPILHEDIVKFAQKRSPFNHMTVAYKKSVIDKVGGYQHHLYMEDYNLWLRVIGAGYKVGNHPNVLLYARVGNGMHARRKGLEYIKSEKQLLDLKKKLKLQPIIYANVLFLGRSALRLLPANLLGKIYNTFLRKKVENRVELE
ncbi:glycosyltransferase [Acinetobacter junii]|jgi:GT2 family glycosyltransferase|uniref:UDP-Gal:alpha-D-GlcNAc-diphosphoundecaprenol beta-1,3-galactosyltransferase n=1 Tax=Acinetobacter venetianus TaxID=52133 RepID=A0A150HKX5_9GAMM|nr:MULTISPECIES: glycosyltransferase [Acinetobacter]KXZ63833.1 UDP-Gal:alpha-D-GlcNAc-diphosphoundecaprenol beta-1,3-galactosyltransferase [Acinetobacter venetianus]KXZ64721.1 UDP-Gal:alpha-D-GlcNAc-diphosphoundecaprenol beta-1,3-galactosyltransferase [Acinetobacter venetianus]MDH0667058.1 glycosyltransferase [Acinetobacter junii]MDI6620373.1 glycosyltransferase [Acinetobacter junii]RTE45816.1 glycosyltransferase [Acinetobacter junii]